VVTFPAASPSFDQYQLILLDDTGTNYPELSPDSETAGGEEGVERATSAINALLFYTDVGIFYG